MANWDPQLLTPSLATAPSAGSGIGPSSSGLAAGNVQAHHGLIGIVLISVAVLVLLHLAGFRFSVTVGKRS